MLKTKVMLPEGCPEVSPWGAVDYGLAHGDGVFLVGTPSHGGFKLPPKVNKTIPELFRRSGGWYEEDCDWAIPVHFLPDLLPDKKIVAKQTLIEWHWQSWEKLTGEIIQPGQSHNKDAFVFKESHKNDFRGVAAFGDWHANDTTRRLVQSRRCNISPKRKCFSCRLRNTLPAPKTPAAFSWLTSNVMLSGSDPNHRTHPEEHGCSST